MAEGWLIDGESTWVWRFHRDDKSWVRDKKVFMDRGRQMPNGIPLLKERRYVREDEAKRVWVSLVSQGWKRTEPLWGASVEP